MIRMELQLAVMHVIGNVSEMVLGVQDITA